MREVLGGKQRVSSDTVLSFFDVAEKLAEKYGVDPAIASSVPRLLDALENHPDITATDRIIVSVLRAIETYIYMLELDEHALVYSDEDEKRRAAELLSALLRAVGERV